MDRITALKTDYIDKLSADIAKLRDNLDGYATRLFDNEVMDGDDDLF